MRLLFDLLKGPAATVGHSATERGCRFAGLLVVALVVCGTRTLIDAVFGPTSTGEATYAHRLCLSLREGMLLPPRRSPTRPRAIKRAISKYQARTRNADRTSRPLTITYQINRLTSSTDP